MTSSTTSSRTGKGRRAQLSAAQVEAADAARAAKIAALHDQISEQVEALTADPQWRAMLDAAAKFHTYSLNNQLLIELQAARLGISPTRVAGFGTWKALRRSGVKGSTGLAVLAPCTYTPKGSRADTGTGQDVRRAAPAATTAAAGEPAGGDTDSPVDSCGTSRAAERPTLRGGARCPRRVDGDDRPDSAERSPDHQDGSRRRDLTMFAAAVTSAIASAIAAVLVISRLL
jgi:hypothetical protein